MIPDAQDSKDRSQPPCEHPALTRPCPPPAWFNAERGCRASDRGLGATPGGGRRRPALRRRLPAHAGARGGDCVHRGWGNGSMGSLAMRRGEVSWEGTALRADAP